MTNGPLQRLVQHLRRSAESAEDGDATLLEQFIREHDEAAFAGLVRRHGGMVWGVCRRVAGHQQDAEDAFQAVFLVLAKKAAAVAAPQQLGNWLYGVAYRTALKAKARAARRRGHEQQVSVMPQPAVEPTDRQRELQPILDQALSRLADKYRLPIVLCDLEGRPRAEVARRLQLPEGTLSSRLATGRRLLADKLARRGLAISGGALATLLAETAQAAEPSASLVDSTVQAATLIAAGETAVPASAGALALTHEVIQAMFMNKLKFAAMFLLAIGLLGSGAGWLTLQALADKPAKPAAPAAAADQANREKKPQGAAIQGVLQALDAAKNTIVLRIAANDGTKQTREETFALVRDVEVLLADTLVKGGAQPAGKLADLTPGISVVLELAADQKAVARITARGPSLQATLQALGSDSLTVWIKEKDKKDPVEKVLKLAKDIKVLFNDGLSKDDKDQEGKLADLAQGTHLHIQLSVDQKTALGIRVAGASLSGTLKGYDVGNNRITITIKGDGGPVDKTFGVAQNARLLDLNDGMRIHLRFSVFDKEKVVSAQGQK